MLQRGQADAIIAGGVSSRIHPMLWARSQVMGQSQRERRSGGRLRPFDALRDGTVSGEGAGALILETQQHAQARGARVLARILGYASAFEPRRNGQPRQGTAIRRAILAALSAAGLEPADVGFVAAHGRSTVDDDRLEAQAIRAVLGDVPVTAPKSYFGHLGAAVRGVGDGAVRAGVSAWAGSAHAQLRTSRPAVPDPRDPRPAVAA